MGRLVFLIFILAIGLCAAFSPEFDIPEDWVDPTDMATFDYGTKTNRKPEGNDGTRTGSRLEENVVPEEEFSQTEEETLSETKTESMKADPDNQKDDGESCQPPFLHRFVAVLHKQLERVGSPPDIQDFELFVHLDTRDWLTIQEFVDECQGLPEVTRVLEDMVKSVHIHVDKGSEWKKKFEDFVHMPFEDFMKLGMGLLLIVAILTIECLSRVPWASQLKRLVIVSFIISLGMTYIHELKLAEADYKSKATDIPPECHGNKAEDTSYWQDIKSVYNDMTSVKNDPCAEYHANFLISPHLKVTPTKVVAVTLTRFAVEPMEHIGTAFSKAFKNIFSGLPITLWIPAFLFVVLVILGFMLIFAVCFGYNFSFNLPFWAGLHMGPQQTIQRNPEMDRVLEDNRRHIDHIDQLQATIRELKEIPQQQLLPAPTVPPSRPRAIFGYFGLGGRDENTCPKEHPSPPPYPAQQPRETNLPYPDVQAPRYPPENRGDYGPSDYNNDMSGSGDSGHSNPGLRRRNTVPRTRERMAYEAGDSQLPSPAGNPKPRTSSASQVPPSEPLPRNHNRFGFEHLLEDDNLKSKTPLREMSSASDIPNQSGRTTVTRPVEEILKLDRGDACKTSPKAVGNSGQNVTKHTKSTSDLSSKVGNLTRDARALPSGGNEANTLPAEEVERVGNNDSPDANLDGWEEVSAEDGACENKKGASEKMNTMELAAIFEREAEKGFESHE